MKSAERVAITCAIGSRHTTYDPPLTYTHRDTTISWRESFSCSSLTTPVSSATATRTQTQATSCLASVRPNAGASTVEYLWDTGRTSVVAFSGTTAVRAANGSVALTSLGKVSSGLGKGSAVTRVVTMPSLNLTACAGAGLSEHDSLTATLAIVP